MHVAKVCNLLDNPKILRFFGPARADNPLIPC